MGARRALVVAGTVRVVVAIAIAARNWVVVGIEGWIADGILVGGGDVVRMVDVRTHIPLDMGIDLSYKIRS